MTTIWFCSGGRRAATRSSPGPHTWRKKIAPTSWSSPSIKVKPNSRELDSQELTQIRSPSGQQALRLVLKISKIVKVIIPSPILNNEILITRSIEVHLNQLIIWIFRFVTESGKIGVHYLGQVNTPSNSCNCFLTLFFRTAGIQTNNLSNSTYWNHFIYTCVYCSAFLKSLPWL